MSKGFRIYINGGDIKKGLRYDSAFCPISVAYKRITGEKYVETKSTLKVFTNSNKTVVKREYYLSQWATDFMDDFDKNVQVKPQQFLLIPVEE
jgi:hypothetical protein